MRKEMKAVERSSGQVINSNDATQKVPEVSVDILINPPVCVLYPDPLLIFLYLFVLDRRQKHWVHYLVMVFQFYLPVCVSGYQETPDDKYRLTQTEMRFSKLQKGWSLAVRLLVISQHYTGQPEKLTTWPRTVHSLGRSFTQRDRRRRNRKRKRAVEIQYPAAYTYTTSLLCSVFQSSL